MKKNNMRHFLAIDLGASSGRHVIGYKRNGNISLKEIYRFPTGMDDTLDGKTWNLERIFNEIKKGIKIAFECQPDITSISIDTWGVDYVLMDNDKEIKPFYAYRNERCIKAAEEVHKIIPFEKLYQTTGIQFASFNTIYQLYDDLKKGRLDNATDYLMIPSYFTYKLTGIKSHEYTNETTGALIDVLTNDYAYDLIDKLGLPRKLFNEILYPTKVIGPLKADIAKEVGGNANVVLCASHDTASAFESVDIDDETVLISSGTWSLLGIKSKNPIVNEASFNANYTNEGGVGYFRFLKNIMGMWIANQLLKTKAITFSFLDRALPLCEYKEIFDVNDPSLVAPENMEKAIKELLKHNPPKNDVELFCSLYRSLAFCYKNCIDELEKITNKTYNKICVVGGGAKNRFLNSMIKEYTKKEVIPMPIEATCLGNIKIQRKVGKTK